MCPPIDFFSDNGVNIHKLVNPPYHSGVYNYLYNDVFMLAMINAKRDIHQYNKQYLNFLIWPASMRDLLI